MRITTVRATWLRAPIPAEHAHVSDFGRNDTFNMCLVEIETDTGLVGLGEAKAAVGNLGNYAAMVTLIREELGPAILGRDPRDVAAIWDHLYSGTAPATRRARGGAFRPSAGGAWRSPRSAASTSRSGPARPVAGRARVAAPRRPLSRTHPAYASGGWAPVAPSASR